MYSRILKRMREKIRTREYVMTLHAEEEMNEDNLAIYDIESAILTGEIIGRLKNEVTWNGNIASGGKLSIRKK